MALNFSKYEPVAFGDLKVMPEVNAEKRLRLQSCEIAQASLDEARALLASCFGDQSEAVAAFMKDNMFLQDYCELQVYLLNGERGLATYRAQVRRLQNDKVDEILAQMTAGVTDNA